jgi:hypothetical protein
MIRESKNGDITKFYFNIHHIDEEQNLSFGIFKLEGHDLTSWENHT